MPFHDKVGFVKIASCLSSSGVPVFNSTAALLRVKLPHRLCYGLPFRVFYGLSHWLCYGIAVKCRSKVEFMTFTSCSNSSTRYVGTQRHGVLEVHHNR